MQKAEHEANAETANEQSSKGVEGLEVAEAKGRQWIEANLGPIENWAPPTVLPHSRGEKVVPLKAPPPEDWRLL